MRSSRKTPIDDGRNNSSGRIAVYVGYRRTVVEHLGFAIAVGCNTVGMGYIGLH